MYYIKLTTQFTNVKNEPKRVKNNIIFPKLCFNNFHMI